jgi:hypothetical protein
MWHHPHRTIATSSVIVVIHRSNTRPGLHPRNRNQERASRTRTAGVELVDETVGWLRGTTDAPWLAYPTDTAHRHGTERITRLG